MTALTALSRAFLSRPSLVGAFRHRSAPAKLQDAVPPFPTEVAMELLEEELGRPPSEVFSEISEEPIAAASLAQV